VLGNLHERMCLSHTAATHLRSTLPAHLLDGSFVIEMLVLAWRSTCPLMYNNLLEKVRSSTASPQSLMLYEVCRSVMLEVSSRVQIFRCRRLTWTTLLSSMKTLRMQFLIFGYAYRLVLDDSVSSASACP
jgi:hypothetical protein